MDDAVALLFALANGALDVRAITTVSGNLTADRCAANALRVLDLANAPNMPVAQGPLKPLVRPYPRDPFSHGSDGLAERNLPDSERELEGRFAPDLILETAEAQGGELTLIALGPLTNVALALIKDPELPKKIKELIIIGGSFGFHTAGATRATGDNPASEWNIYVDPEAAALVFAAGFNLTAIGLDVAAHPDVALNESHRARLRAASTPAALFLLDVTDFVERRGFRSYCGLIDSLAIAAAIDPSILTLETVAVAVETESSLSRGQTVVDRRDHFRRDDLPLINAASAFNPAAYFNLLLEAMTSTPAKQKAEADA
jgi:purine nucleosidase/pyrimidine-specific ribonucleoside hydrolase